MNELAPKESGGEFLLYQTEDGQVRLDVRMEGETVWLTQRQIAGMFQVKPQNITMHLKNIYQEGELDESATCKDFLQVQIEGGREVKRQRKYYNLDAIISVGYRVNSIRGMHFRIWATQRLRAYIIKGFALDDVRPREAGGAKFKKAWQESNYGTIIAVAHKIPEKILQENPKLLLMWYNQALTRTEEE